MDLIDINEWASDATRSLEVTQTFLHAPYTLEVKQFIPIDGDMLQEIWTDGNGIVRKHDIPPYALHDMGKTAKSIQTFVDKNIATYITGVTGNSDDLLWKTYYMAFQHSEKAAVSHHVFLDMAFGPTDQLFYRKKKKDRCFRTLYGSGLRAE